MSAIDVEVVRFIIVNKSNNHGLNIGYLIIIVMDNWIKAFTAELLIDHTMKLGFRIEDYVMENCYLMLCHRHNVDDSRWTQHMRSVELFGTPVSEIRIDQSPKS